MTDIQDLLESLYAASRENEIRLPPEQEAWIDEIVHNAERQKGVLAALITSLVKKIASPEQDIRLHKSSFSGGYSGRVFDTQYVTPFIRRKFPRLAMKSGSGWLTRSIEQAAPFDMEFPGKIQNSAVKKAFLSIIHDVQVNAASPRNYLLALFKKLTQAYPPLTAEIPKSVSSSITVAHLLDLLKLHFSHNYGVAGASRLPVIAIYSTYQLLMHTPRYSQKSLLPLKSHTTSDSRSMSIGDVEIVDQHGDFFEAVEIKHNIPINRTTVEDAFEKFRAFPVDRYYLLTTAEPNSLEPDAVDHVIKHILNTHGCEVIINGIVPSLKYYLRLLPTPSDFIEIYTKNLQLEYQMSSDLKQVHLERWYQLLAP